MYFLVNYLKHPEWRRQHRWRHAIWRTMSRVGLTGLHALPLSRRWVDIHRRTMPMKNLDPALAGLRIVHISDLHYSPLVWHRYLIQMIRWINATKPDLVLITGDLISGGYRFARRIATVLSHLHATHGVVCSFGNHDYSIYGRNGSDEGERRADFLQQSLVAHGVRVLRNEAMQVWPKGANSPLILVGLDDEWSGHRDADRAFAGVSDDAAIICMNHNPATCPELVKYPWQWMLSGHTHGRQVVRGPFSRLFYPHRYRHFTHGHYSVNGRNLYVNRGLSYGQRIRDWCRPEITVFKLAPE